jgi:alpha-beta hydrolase superfamily lysophospholipase
MCVKRLAPAAVATCLQTGEFDQIAARISAALKLNCGQKAVILAHSMGGNVMLHMMRQPRFEEWRYVGGLPA